MHPKPQRNQSEIMKAWWAKPESRIKHREAMNASLPDAGLRRKFSAAAKAKWADPEARRRQSNVMKTIYAEPTVRRRSSHISKTSWRFYTCRKGRVFHMKAPTEAMVAEWLDARGYAWEYEPRPPIKLPNGTTYLPDFRLADGRLLEVKGRHMEGLHKVHAARAAGHRVIVLKLRAMRKLGMLVDYTLSRYQIELSVARELAARGIDVTVP